MPRSETGHFLYASVPAANYMFAAAIVVLEMVEGGRVASAITRSHVLLMVRGKMLRAAMALTFHESLILAARKL